MKVALVTAFPRDPAAPRGGVEAVSVNLARSLAKLAGLEMHVVTTERGGRRTQMDSWSGITIHRLPAGSGPLLAYAVGPGRHQVQDYLRALRPDVVHAHDTYGIMVKGLPLPRVFTVHGFIHEDTRSAGGLGAWIRSQAWRRVETSSWAEQPHIIAITPFVRERLRGVVRGAIHEIENPINESFFGLDRQESGAVVFCAAAMRKLKNILGLVKAFARLLENAPEARLRLAGPVTEPDYAREVQAFVEHQGLTEKVSFLGALTGEQVRAELSRASVAALVSYHENAPMCIAEAMAAGVPMVASNRCGIPYMICDGQSGFLVEPEDIDGIAQRLGTLLADAGLRARMGERASQAALTRFHPDAVAASTLRVYRSALEGRVARARGTGELATTSWEGGPRL